MSSIRCSAILESYLDNTVLLNQLQEKTPDGLSGGKDGLLGTGDIFNRRSKESYVV